MVRTLREGGGVKDGPPRKIIIDILLKTLRRNIKIKLDHVVGWQCPSFLTGLLQYLAKYMVLLVKKFCGGFFSNSVSRVFKTKKKVPMATKLDRGEAGPGH